MNVGVQSDVLPADIACDDRIASADLLRVGPGNAVCAHGCVGDPIVVGGDVGPGARIVQVVTATHGEPLAVLVRREASDRGLSSFSGRNRDCRFKRDVPLRPEAACGQRGVGGAEKRGGILTVQQVGVPAFTPEPRNSVESLPSSVSALATLPVASVDATRIAVSWTCMTPLRPCR